MPSCFSEAFEPRLGLRAVLAVWSYTIIDMPTQTYTAVVHREDTWYVAECPEVGVVSQGKSIGEAITNLKEATELYLEEFPPPRSEVDPEAFLKNL